MKLLSKIARPWRPSAETARALHESSAHLYLAVRNVGKGKEVAEQILGNSRDKTKIEVLKLELDSLESVRQCAKDFLEKSATLNVLINNAGTFHETLEITNIYVHSITIVLSLTWTLSRSASIATLPVQILRHTIECTNDNENPARA